MNEPAQREMPHVGVFWLVQRRSAAPHCRVPAGPSRAVWRLSNLRPYIVGLLFVVVWV